MGDADTPYQRLADEAGIPFGIFERDPPLIQLTREEGERVMRELRTTPDWTPEQVEEFRRRFAKAATRHPKLMKFRTRRGRACMVPALSRRTRIRLWSTGRANRIGGWLLEHGHEGAAIAFWRACGMW